MLNGIFRKALSNAVDQGKQVNFNSTQRANSLLKMVSPNLRGAAPKVSLPTPPAMGGAGVPQQKSKLMGFLSKNILKAR
jgi:hypothetical protein